MASATPLASDALAARVAALESENRRLEAAGRLKNEILASTAHDVRTYLNAILGFGQIILDSKVEPPLAADHREYLGDLLESAESLRRLISDVLDIARIEAGKMEFVPEPVDLPAAAKEVVSLLRGQAARKRVMLEVEIDPDASTAVVDRAKLLQLLYNYVSNGIKFTPEGGKVSVAIRSRAPDRFCIEVRDTGPGIAPEDVEKLFVEFQQPGAGPARPGGTGLGLALTRRLVEAQGGQVGVETEVGKGSAFFAVLPRQGTATSGRQTAP